MNPFSSSINLLEWLTEPRKVVYVPDCQFVIRRIQLRNSQQEGKHRARPMGRARSSHTLECPTLPKSPRARQPQMLPEPHPFGCHGGCIRQEG